MTRQRGAVLLEALVAIAITGACVAAIAPLLQQSFVASAFTARAQEDLEQADQLLSAMTLWSRTELDLRLGDRRQARFVARITRRSPILYDAAVLDSSRSRVWLSTTLFRPGPAVPQ
ncbi:MAG: type II secretion system protein [Gemmatimonadaceae bacterium]